MSFRAAYGGAVVLVQFLERGLVAVERLSTDECFERRRELGRQGVRLDGGHRRREASQFVADAIGDGLAKEAINALETGEVTAHQASSATASPRGHAR